VSQYQKGKTNLDFTEARDSKIQISFTFLLPAHPGSPGQRAVKRVCVRVNLRDSKDENQQPTDLEVWRTRFHGPVQAARMLA